MPLLSLSSMAVRGLLAELAAGWDGAVEIVSVGGVEAARRLREGEVVDVVVLADGALDRLEQEGLLRPGRRPVALSPMAAAVRSGGDAPDLRSAEGFRESLRAAGRIGHSTGPSGEHLLRLLEAWGLRGLPLVQAPPGVPVGRLLADGAVDLAVQQRSELMGIGGIVVAGDLPPGAAVNTVFAAAVAAASVSPDEAARLVAFLARAHRDTKQRHGMQPV